MSNRYKGGVISATPPTTTGGESGTASGAWTLEQQMQLQAAGLWPLQPTGPYIEEVFQTWLYTGNAGTQTVTNGIDLAGKGGMVWIKSRSGAFPHNILDTVRGFNYSGTQTRRLDTATTDNEADSAGNATQATPLSNGFSVTTSGGGAINFYNASGSTYASWTFREQSKFFDIVTYTGTGSVQNISHNLGSVPGCMIIKDTTNNGSAWAIYHTSLGNTQFLQFTTSAAGTSSGYWNNTTPTSTQFTVGTNGNVNQSGATYVAYLFAHNAGGFGLSGNDNVISCGSYSGNNTTPVTVTLGYEPQWILIKRTNAAQNWTLYDNMRGIVTGGVDPFLRPNTADEEVTTQNWISVTATGFQLDAVDQQINVDGSTYIYIAIRRGPMRVPTTGTSVFYPKTWTGTATTTNITDVGFPPDFFLGKKRSGSFARDAAVFDRLRGTELVIYPSSTTSEQSQPGITSFSLMTGYQVGAFDNVNSNTFFGPGQSYIHYSFRRAPSFMDVVCYTGTGSARTQAHNLGVVPELIIVKVRNDSESWQVYSAETGNTRSMSLNNSNAAVVLNNWNNTTPTASVFSLGTFNAVNGSGLTYVAYLFASAPGVSKVGSYTGTGATQTINCGFTGGARFVLIKATSTTGDWLYWDTARGMIPSNDPYLVLNTTADEVTGTDWVDTAATGFELSDASGNSANTNGVSYIFLAIA